MMKTFQITFWDPDLLRLDRTTFCGKTAIEAILVFAEWVTDNGSGFSSVPTILRVSQVFNQEDKDYYESEETEYDSTIQQGEGRIESYDECVIYSNRVLYYTYINAILNDCSKDKLKTFFKACTSDLDPLIVESMIVNYGLYKGIPFEI